MIKLIKEIVYKKVKNEDKRYTNYILEIKINDKIHNVPIMPKTFGKEWTHPAVRHSFTILDLVSELKLPAEEEKEKDK